MSDFAITSLQRRQLLAGTYHPLDFQIKPYGCVPGARYVLVWTREQAVVCDDGFVIRIPRQPVLWLDVTAVVRHRKGFWRVRYDITDLRDEPRYLAAGGGYTGSRWRAVDELPCVPAGWQERHSKTVREFEIAERLKAYQLGQRERSRFRRGRRAA